MEHTCERSQTDVPTSIGNPRINGTELYTVVLRKTPYRRVNPAAVSLPGLFLSGLREVLFHHTINGSLVFHNGVVQERISGHDEVPSRFVNLHPCEVVLALEGESPPEQYVKAPAALGLLGVALTQPYDFCRQRGEETVLVIPIVNVNPHIAIIIEHEPAVVIVSLRHGLASRVEGRPCFRIGRGSGFWCGRFHRNFAVATSTDPLIQLFQFFGNVLVACQIRFLLLATLRSNSLTKAHTLSCLMFLVTETL